MPGKRICCCCTVKCFSALPEEDARRVEWEAAVAAQPADSVVVGMVDVPEISDFFSDTMTVGGDGQVSISPEPRSILEGHTYTLTAQVFAVAHKSDHTLSTPCADDVTIQTTHTTEIIDDFTLTGDTDSRTYTDCRLAIWDFTPTGADTLPCCQLAGRYFGLIGKDAGGSGGSGFYVPVGVFIESGGLSGTAFYGLYSFLQTPQSCVPYDAGSNSPVCLSGPALTKPICRVNDPMELPFVRDYDILSLHEQTKWHKYQLIDCPDMDAGVAGFPNIPCSFGSHLHTDIDGCTPMTAAKSVMSVCSRYRQPDAEPVNLHLTPCNDNSAALGAYERSISTAADIQPGDVIRVEFDDTSGPACYTVTSHDFNAPELTAEWDLMESCSDLRCPRVFELNPCSCPDSTTKLVWTVDPTMGEFSIETDLGDGPCIYNATYKPDVFMGLWGQLPEWVAEDCPEGGLHCVQRLFCGGGEDIVCVSGSAPAPGSFWWLYPNDTIFQVGTVSDPVGGECGAGWCLPEFGAEPWSAYHAGEAESCP